MLPTYIIVKPANDFRHFHPTIQAQPWRDAIEATFTEQERTSMMVYPNNCHYMLDALRRSINCRPGMCFAIFDRVTADWCTDTVYEIVSKTETRLVANCYPIKDGKLVNEQQQRTFEGDKELDRYLVFFLGEKADVDSHLEEASKNN